MNRDIDVFGESSAFQVIITLTPLDTASIDQEAFHQIPDIVAGADMIDDDLPTNLDYLDQTTRPLAASARDRSTGETLRTWEPAEFGENDPKFAAEIKGETIRILFEKPFDMIEDYLDQLPVTGGQGEE